MAEAEPVAAAASGQDVEVGFRKMLEEDSAKKPAKKVSKWLLSSVGVSLCTVILVALILWIINPPMVQKKTESDIEKVRPSAVKIIVWSLLAGTLVFIGPFIVKWIVEKGKKKTDSAFIPQSAEASG